MRALLILCAALSSCASNSTVPQSTKIVVSIKKQEASLVNAKTLRPIKKFPVSTGKGGIGTRPQSNATPTGHFAIVKEVGEGQPINVGIKGDSVVPNTKGKDPIISRSIWITGLDSDNKNSLKRYIRLHGTPFVEKIGTPVSLGCVRFLPQDIATVCNYVSVGTPVEILPQ